MNFIFNANLELEAHPANGGVTNALKLALANEPRTDLRDFSLSLSSGSAMSVPFYGLSEASEVFVGSSEEVTVKFNDDPTGKQIKSLWLTGANLTSLVIENSSGSAADIRILLMEA